MKIRQQKKNGRLIPVMDTDLADFPGERWKEIPGFEHYLLSDYGRVKSVGRLIERSNGQTFLKQEKILRLRLMRIDRASKSLLVQMTLFKEGAHYSFSVSRFVYHLFIAPIDLNDRSIIVKRKNNDHLNCYYKNLALQLPLKATKEDFDAPDKKNILKKKLVAEYPDAALLNTDIANLPREKWKDIPGFEGKYQLSNYGRVKNVTRDVPYNNGRTVRMRERIHALAISPLRRDPGHFSITVTLMKDGTAHKYSVPRLVYNLFVTPFDVDNLSLLISKKDNSDLNCYYKNLQLRTIAEVKINTYTTRGVENVLRNMIKAVHQYDRNGKFLRSYTSIRDASKVTKIGVTQITNAVYRRQLQGKQYYWRTNDPRPQIDLSVYRKNEQAYMQSMQRLVHKLSLDGKILETLSLTEAAKKMGFKSKNSIIQACKNNNLTRAGFKWRYAERDDRGDRGDRDERKHTGKPRKVHQYAPGGKWVGTYPSVAAAARAIGIVSSAISNAVRLKHKTAKNYYWRYGRPHKKIDVSVFSESRKRKLNSRKKQVQQFTLSGKLLKSYESVAAVANALGIGTTGVRRACKDFTITCGGFRWRFAGR